MTRSGRSGGAGNPGQGYFYDHGRLPPFVVLISGLPLVSLRRRRTGVKIGGWYRP
jgi:hypothetical protein